MQVSEAIILLNAPHPVPKSRSLICVPDDFVVGTILQVQFQVQVEDAHYSHGGFIHEYVVSVQSGKVRIKPPDGIHGSQQSLTIENPVSRFAGLDLS